VRIDKQHAPFKLNSMPESKKIMGIDPGTNIMGYAVIKITGNNISVMSLGVIQLQKVDDHYTRLQKIYEKISFQMEAWQPDEMAIEAPFFGKNVQAMLKLGRAQGVAIAAAMMHNISVQEYAPRKIKQAITGNGNANKAQVATMLKQQLKLDTLPKYFDATDALGVALCHYLQSSNPLARLNNKFGRKTGSKKSNNWKAFIEANPDKVK